MTIKCRYKFTQHIPFQLESRLVYQYGFRVMSRKQGEWVILEKELRLTKPKDFVTELSDHDQMRLIKRCNAVMDYYNDPDEYADDIRRRLHNMAQASPMVEGLFIRNWAERNVGKAF
jgi:hypothetical protein